VFKAPPVIISGLFLLIINPLVVAQKIETSRQLEILAIGATLPQMTPVVPWLSQEPLASVSHVPNRGFGSHLLVEEYQRLVRLYFPRTYREMLEYDVFLYVGGCVQYLSSSQVSQLKKAVSEGGRSALGDLGGVSTTEEIVMSWISSGMWEIFPNDAPDVVTRGEWSRGPFWVKVHGGRENNPLEPFVELGIEKVTGDFGRRIVPRDGLTLYASMTGISFNEQEDPPFIVAWDYDKGRTLLVAQFFNHPWFHTPNQGGENAYAPDVLVNLLLNALGRTVFQEIIILHEVRMRIQEYHQKYAIVLSTLDFVERFGANTNSIRSDLAETVHMHNRALTQYLDLDVTGAMNSLENAIGKVNLLIVGSMDLKDRALLWIYIIEWFFVTGTLMTSGSILYMVMIRRRLFRDISQTRLRSRE
jgi:hypothetical protein